MIYSPSVLEVFEIRCVPAIPAVLGPLGGGFRVIQDRRQCHLSRQDSIPAVVFRKPMRTKKGTQTVAMTMPKLLNTWS